MRRALVITNADAGSNDDESVEQALAVLRAAGHRRRRRGDLRAPDELDRVLADRDGREIVVAGGDGSLHAVVAALHARDELGATPRSA